MPAIGKIRYDAAAPESALRGVPFLEDSRIRPRIMAPFSFSGWARPRIRRSTGNTGRNPTGNEIPEFKSRRNGPLSPETLPGPPGRAKRNPHQNRYPEAMRLRKSAASALDPWSSTARSVSWRSNAPPGSPAGRSPKSSGFLRTFL